MAGPALPGRQGRRHSLILVPVSPANGGNSELQTKPEFCFQTYLMLAKAQGTVLL